MSKMDADKLMAVTLNPEEMRARTEYLSDFLGDLQTSVEFLQSESEVDTRDQQVFGAGEHVPKITESGLLVDESIALLAPEVIDALKTAVRHHISHRWKFGVRDLSCNVN